MPARKNTTKSTTATAKKAVASSLEENVVVENTIVPEENTVKNTTPLKNEDEIEVISLIPNVSYKDDKTGDFYEWDEIGHSELMTFETIKNMWRSYKTYFREMWLKPNDERVIKQFGLAKKYENYESLMNESSYTRKNIDEICDRILSLPNGMKYTVCNLIKSKVASGDISDVYIIKIIERKLNFDLLSLIN